MCCLLTSIGAFATHKNLVTFSFDKTMAVLTNNASLIIEYRGLKNCICWTEICMQKRGFHGQHFQTLFDRAFMTEVRTLFRNDLWIRKGAIHIDLL